MANLNNNKVNFNLNVSGLSNNYNVNNKTNYALKDPYNTENYNNLFNVNNDVVNKYECKVYPYDFVGPLPPGGKI